MGRSNEVVEGMMGQGERDGTRERKKSIGKMYYFYETDWIGVEEGR